MRSLILSGWTQPIDALAHIETDAATFDYSDYPTLAAAFDALKNVNHTTCVAWSMGGQIALAAIASGALQVAHLTLIAVPYQFVSDVSVSDAMDPLTFNQFRSNYASNPARTKTRFHGLVAKGDRDFSRVLGALTHHPEVENTARWLPWLDRLAEGSIAALDLDRVPPTLIIHGAADAIVPVSQAALLAEKLPQVQVHLWPESGHAPHVHDAVRLRAEIAAHRALHGIV